VVRREQMKTVRRFLRIRTVVVAIACIATVAWVVPPKLGAATRAANRGSQETRPPSTKPPTTKAPTTKPPTTKAPTTKPPSGPTSTVAVAAVPKPRPRFRAGGVGVVTLRPLPGDDLPALRAAYTELCRSNGGTLQLAPGVFDLSDGWRLDRCPVVVEGAGAGQTVLVMTGRDRYSVHVYNLDNSAIRDVTIRTLIGQARSHGHTLMVERSRNVVIEDVEVIGGSAFGIYVASRSTNVTVRRSIARDQSADGIHIQNAESVLLEDNFIDHTGDDGIGVTHWLGEPGIVRDVVIRRNVVRDSGSRGIAVVGGFDVVVEDNEIDATFLGGLTAESGGGFGAVRRVSFDRNRLRNIGYVAQRDSHVESPSGFVWGVTIRSADGTPISRVRVLGNSIDGTYNGFVRIGDGRTSRDAIADISVSDNVFTGPVRSGSPSPRSFDPGVQGGIYVDGARSAVIERNRLQRTTGEPVVITEANDRNDPPVVRENVIF
jgi:polygalacturonase